MAGGPMDLERMRELDRDMKARLTKEEVAQGYRFCCEWDGLLIYKDDPEAECCGCLRIANGVSPKLPR